MAKQVQRIGKASKYDIWTAIDNSVKMMNNNFDAGRFTCYEYKMVRGYVKVVDTTGEYDGYADVSVFEVEQGVYIALPVMYAEEGDFEVVASDGSEWICDGIMEVFTRA